MLGEQSLRCRTETVTEGLDFGWGKGARHVTKPWEVSGVSIAYNISLQGKLKESPMAWDLLIAKDDLTLTELRSHADLTGTDLAEGDARPDRGLIVKV